MSNLAQHQKSDAIKWGVVTVVILLIIATIVVGIGSSWFTNWNVKTWFGRTDETEQTGKDKDKKETNALVVGEAVSNSPYLALASAVAVSDNSATITATVKDAGGETPDDLQLVDWSIAWATSNSATVTDYIELSPNRNSVTLNCLKAFGTQIVVTCASQLDPAISATATVDYTKRAESAKVSFLGTESAVVNGGTVSFTLPDFSTIGTNQTWTSKSLGFYTGLNFGDGTIDNAVTAGSYKVRANDNFKTALHNENSSLSGDGMLANGGSSTGTASLADFMDKFAGFASSNYRYAFYRAMAATDNQFSVEVSIGTSKSGSFAATYTLNVEATAPAVNSVELDNGAIVF